jgi:hypothetical protein
VTINLRLGPSSTLLSLSFKMTQVLSDTFCLLKKYVYNSGLFPFFKNVCLRVLRLA